MAYFQIEGGNPLRGEVEIPGAKNAALPMLCASLLTREKCIFHNVPEISDVVTLLDLFDEMGAEVAHDFASKTVEITAKDLDLSKLVSSELAKKMRASILTLGPLLARFGSVQIRQPGGCVIGARSNATHLDAFQNLGATISEVDDSISVSFDREKFAHNWVLFSEASVTATENLALFAAGIEDEVDLFFTAAEPHVQATCRMLQQMGAQVSGIGTHHLSIRGTKNLTGGEFTLPPDGILVGTYAVAAALTRGDLLLKNVDHTELLSFYGALKRIGVNFQIQQNALRVSGEQKFQAIPKIQTAIYPGFPTDLQSLVGVLLTQCAGKSMIFETLFENRFTYLVELERMGAKVKILNPHQAKIYGPTPLHGAEVQSWDLRAGAAMVIAGLVGEGTTRVSHINYIERGYERFEENLRALGADIRRVEK
ncbi:MAG: UDP-N-acetylglucosamine 1-carboxyvinyltransferase [Candidatus Gracilibacteria bacterium]|nr:UDP-N-acetylglucosamine 1-carboxyvinyltransferase [Candidatus Gracilibacteria bacterium]